MKKNTIETLQGFSSLAYKLAIQGMVLNEVMTSMFKGWAKESQREIRNLKRRGIAIIEIRDKGIETTHHPKENVENMLNEFVKKNNKWKWEKEVSSKIKTGKYILTRIYRKYYKKTKDKDYCECCGREFE